jgi:hypothetical protein
LTVRGRSTGFGTAVNTVAAVQDQVSTGSMKMLDAIFIVGGLAFFAISVGYTLLCERL